MRSVLAALVLLLAGAAPAAAAPPWSPSQPVEGSAWPGPTDLALTPGPGERALLSWSAFGANTGIGRLVAVDGDRPVTAVRNLAPYDLAAPPARYGTDGTVLLLRRPTGRPDVPSDRLMVALGRTDATVGRRHLLDAHVRLASAPAVAANLRGDVAVVWVEDRGDDGGGRLRDDRLWISTRRQGGAFSTPKVLVGSGDLQDADVAIGARGHLQVAFTRRVILRRHRLGPKLVQARFRRDRGGWHRIDTLGPHQGYARFASAVTPSGRGYVAWRTQDIGEEANERQRVYVAVRPAGPNPYRARQALDPGSDVQPTAGGLALAVQPDQSAVVAWSRPAAGGNPIVVADAGPDGRFGRLRPVAGADGTLGGLTSGPSGTTLVWSEADSGVRSATRPPGRAAFGPAELVAAGPVSAEAATAITTAGGRALVAWATAPGDGRIALGRRDG